MTIIEITFDYAGAPIGKPRMTRSDVWRDPPRACVGQWYAFKDAFILAAKQAGFDPSTDTVQELNVTARIAMPRSWSRVKQAEMWGQHHQQKPDVDNILKAIADALTTDDSGIYLMTLCKRWAKPEYEGLSVIMTVKREVEG
jgi:Holliday junction resolvase RusA-like endonuclease